MTRGHCLTITCLQDIPTLVVSDPASATSWTWSASLDRWKHIFIFGMNYHSTVTFVRCSEPKYTAEALKNKVRPVDPFSLVEKDLSTLSNSIKELLGSDHPVLEKCAR